LVFLFERALKSKLVQLLCNQWGTNKAENWVDCSKEGEDHQLMAQRVTPDMLSDWDAHKATMYGRASPFDDPSSAPNKSPPPAMQPKL
jgi:hypothetical protein